MWSVFALATAMKLFSLLLIASLTALALGHGYIRNPAARNACKQYGFEECIIEWTMDEKNCGGFLLNGKITVESVVYVAIGTITGIYKEGQLFELQLNITVSHKGWSEFRVGDIGTPPITQAKLNHLLKLEDGTTRWMHPGKAGLYKIMLQLPAGLKCRHCVLQWWWRTGNSWGCDSDGCGLGHGPQEHFVNCADITIIPKDGVLPTLPPTKAPPPRSTRRPPPDTPAPPSGGVCKSIGPWASAGMDNWCQQNCALGHCPSDRCKCT
ncbi:predicted protein [Nematostella vectensis]|uniref:Chitin-binding type-4 domain-containing protein n=1 Tax=Nematostella vectensis TaxID=45351 RepID=A7S605_NEMVE|nr:predicted protein [Nematostella vectensis]|eukprot:XP_001632962.1 predicted protein [Nematostella vectensis]